MPKTAQIFTDNGHQAIRLPEDIHLSGTEVEIQQDVRTGAITLTPRDGRSEQRRQEDWIKLLDSFSELSQEERDLFVIPRDPAAPTVRDSLR